MTDDIQIIKAIITGRVQGVGYRYWTVQTAQDLGLHGTVRNCDDGSVCAIFKGPQTKLDQMISACHDGPSFAKVKDVMVSEGAYDGPPEFKWIK